MVTEFGKILRMYRIQHGLILKDMADALDIPSSYLSAMEMGRKSVSNDFLQRLFNIYRFTSVEQQELKIAAAKSADQYKLSTKNVDSTHKELAFSFARKFEELDEETVTKILELLK